jgi:deazaflavin-dependent oxidoreductase (nitroreductase family)
VTRIARALNRLTIRLSGKRWFPLWAVMHHRGRRSGKLYATPIAARRTPDGFIVSLAFGKEADWVRNVLAAGACVITWRGADYNEVDSRVVEWSEGKAAFNSAQRVFLRLAGIRAFMQLRDAPQTR